MAKLFDALGYYEILDVDFDADDTTIKTQYYKYAKAFHPDHNSKSDALEIFQKISAAYDVLSDKNLRLKYDLLSLIYSENDFPDMNMLKSYKNQSGMDDIALRVLNQRKVVGRIFSYEVKNTKDICSFSEAKDMVLATSAANWFKGWWHIKAIEQNIKAIRYNFAQSSGEQSDNFKLFVHNALAYAQEGKNDLAWVYAMQAKNMTQKESRENQLLEKYLATLDFQVQGHIVLPKWEKKELKFRQCLIPLCLLLCFMLASTSLLFGLGIIKHQDTNAAGYYRKIKFNDGTAIADDQVDAHIVKVDSDFSDVEMLYHLINDADVFYGPDEKYDLMIRLKSKQTVRVIGYTVNKEWSKIMLDNADTGFIRSINLKQGIGKMPPSYSKIYRR